MPSQLGSRGDAAGPLNPTNLENGALPTGLDPKPRSANRIRKLARCFARCFVPTSPNLTGFSAWPSADLALAAICQNKSHDVKQPEEKLAIATQAPGGSYNYLVALLYLISRGRLVFAP